LASDASGRIANGLRDALAPITEAGGTSTAPLLPRSFSQLGWLGIDADMRNQLEPYVTLLPARTAVNVNTAPREVLAATIKGLDLATAERLVQTRQRGAFKTLQDVEAQLPGLGPLNAQQVTVTSSYFEVRGRLRLGDRVLEQRSLVQRIGADVIALQREQLSSRDQPGS
jgi:general secretion pathway protein K